MPSLVVVFFQIGILYLIGLHGERTKGAVVPPNDNKKCKESNERGAAAQKTQSNPS